MQQRQLRLGDTLDDYCPRERRLTNHAIVAMVGDAIKQTRCTTCDAEHEYKQARVPRQRRKAEPASLVAQILTPKRVVHGAPLPAEVEEAREDALADAGEEPVEAAARMAADDEPTGGGAAVRSDDGPVEEGPVHRTLIRAQLPRSEGQPPASRPAPDFTIRQPTGRPHRFRPREPRAGQSFQGHRPTGNSNGNSIGGMARGGGHRPPGGRPPLMPRGGQHQGPSRRRSK